MSLYDGDHFGEEILMHRAHRLDHENSKFDYEDSLISRSHDGSEDSFESRQYKPDDFANPDDKADPDGEDAEDKFVELNQNDCEDPEPVVKRTTS
mmetsp:Transcript_28923/g.33019  ORF Transcript_28923/g.33019 Transcript_28923/m.33019 type:complete len:95 (-) Transcript_28923:247-531(-)